MRKFVLIFAALTGDAATDLEERLQPRNDFPVVISASTPDEAASIADRIAAMSHCQTLKIVPLAQRPTAT
jgi:hypothetical protein